ncbi:MAG TPA: hypothetical protein VI199_07455 [Novosphingobium sp.]
MRAQDTRFGVLRTRHGAELEQEETMRSISNFVLPVIIAASASGLMFTATLL